MPSIAKPKHPKYSVHPGVSMVENWVATLRAKTGKSLDEWIALGKKQGPKDAQALREWFKTEHGLGTNSAWWMADRVLGLATGEEDRPEGYLKKAVEYVDGMYQGGKAGLRPLHDALIELGLSMGKDVRTCPCATMVPLYRNHVFAQIKPSTRTRIDLGFALGSLKPTGRLIDTGGFAKKDRITHRMEITSLGDIDAEVKKWLRAAYDRDAK